jgi:putative DNA primase/helicase
MPTEKQRDIADDTLKWAHRSQDAKRINNLLDLARCEPSIPVLPDQLDRDPWLLNVQNGTIDLRTGEIRAHDPDDFITKLCPVIFDPAADCPTWRSFLSTIMPITAITEYLQRLAGYWITGRTTDHILPVLYGTGANGKSTFVNTIFEVLGPDYSGKAPRDLLIAARGEKHPTAQAWLHGKRFVCCIETADGARLDEALVKDLTGGGKITARRMREDLWSFESTHKIALVTNHKPQVRGTDYAMWRRLRVIPFTVMIPPERQDKELPDKLRKELPGILNWMLEGCSQLQQIGLADPLEVILATSQYRDEQDRLGAFITERCTIGKDLRASISDFYKAYKEWCKANGEEESTNTAFGLAMGERGYFKDKGKRNYIGIRLKTPDELRKEKEQAERQDPKSG